MINSKNKKTNTAGFTLFVAMVVSSLLLAVGFSISNIIFKQLLLSGSGRDSQIAFYAADSGTECAQFWDARNGDGTPASGDGPFATSTFSDPADSSNPLSLIKCGSGFGVVNVAKISGDATTTLAIDYSYSTDYKACALVFVEKGFEDVSGEQIPYTKITSRGYNSGRLSGTDVGCDTSNKRTVERGIVVQY
jgi:hypothetical protein